jgi:Cof subfamily protein (haloacid dehalogenase superfamily)
VAYRLLVSDVDGTLLDPNSEVTPRVREALRAAAEAGCAVTLATGRSLALARPVAAALGLEVPLILHSGAVIREARSGAVLYDCHLPLEPARAAVAAAIARGLQPLVFENAHRGERVLTGPAEFDNSATRRYLRNKLERCHRLPYRELPGEHDPLCVTVLGNQDNLRSFRAELETIPGCRGALAVLPAVRSHLLDILGRGCSKAAALSALASRLGISLAEVIAVGDHANDLEMIRAAGVGVAMGNAPEEVRAVADWVAPPNTEDGLAAVVERFILAPEAFHSGYADART